jgi:hypothetical protein
VEAPILVPAMEPDCGGGSRSPSPATAKQTRISTAIPTLVSNFCLERCFGKLVFVTDGRNKTTETAPGLLAKMASASWSSS